MMQYSVGRCGYPLKSVDLLAGRDVGLEMQEMRHIFSLHCSPTRQSVWPRQANLQVPPWQVEPPSQSPSARQPWLSLMQVLWSSGLGMKPCRH